MVINKLLKRFLIALLIMCFSMPVFAIEEYVSDVYKKIDEAFSEKSDKELNIVLQANNGDKYYYLMENYATKKVRRLIITNDYEFAMDAIIVIIDNNMDNVDAVEMYAAISDAYEMQKKKEEEEIARVKREEARIAALKEGQRASAEKQFNAVKDTEGKTVFNTGKDGKLSYTGWNVNVGLNPALLSNSSDEVNTLLFGAVIEGQFYTSVGPIILGGDLFGNFHFLNIPLSGSDSSLYAQFEVFPKVAIPALSDKLFFKVGFAGVVALKTQKYASADTLNNLFTPAIGVNLDNVRFGKVGLNAGFDYYMGHLWTPDLNFAMGVKANFCIPVTETELIKLNFNIGIKDTLFIKSNGIENRFNVILALGVQNVTR